MNVTVNGTSHELDAPLTVEQLLDRLELDSRAGIAVARNLMVVPRSSWPSECVEEGDQIEIVRATQGG